MAKTTVPDYPRGLTFEQVWAAIHKTSVEQEKTEKMIKELGKRMGDLHNRFGEIAEHLVAPGIVKRFNERGFHFDSIAPGGLKILNEDRSKVKAQIDLILENGENIIAIEVKTRVLEKDIEHHIRRLEILKENREKKQEKPKKIWGAVAGAIFGPLEKKAALEAGLYVLEQSGDTMKMELSDDFVPRQW